MKRFLKGILFASLSSVIAISVYLAFSIVFLGYKINSIIIFFIISFGWMFGIKIKKREIGNVSEPIRQSKFGIPVITIFSIISVYFINVVLVAYYLGKEKKLPFLEGLSYSWMGIFKISSEIYTDWAWIILIAIVSVVVFIKAEKNEKLNKKN